MARAADDERVDRNGGFGHDLRLADRGRSRVARDADGERHVAGVFAADDDLGSVRPGRERDEIRRRRLPRDEGRGEVRRGDGDAEQGVASEDDSARIDGKSSHGVGRDGLVEDVHGPDPHRHVRGRFVRDGAGRIVVAVDDLVFDLGRLRAGQARRIDHGGAGNDVGDGCGPGLVRDMEIGVDAPDSREGGDQVAGTAAKSPDGETDVRAFRKESSRAVHPDDGDGTRAFGRRVGLRGTPVLVRTGVLVVRVVVHVASIAPLEVVVQTAMDRTGYAGPTLSDLGRGEGDRSVGVVRGMPLDAKRDGRGAVHGESLHEHLSERQTGFRRFDGEGPGLGERVQSVVKAEVFRFASVLVHEMEDGRGQVSGAAAGLAVEHAVGIVGVDRIVGNVPRRSARPLRRRGPADGEVDGILARREQPEGNENAARYGQGIAAGSAEGNRQRTDDDRRRFALGDRCP